MKNIVPITITILVVLLVVSLILILIPKDNSSISYETFRAKTEIGTFFNAVINEKYEKAVKHVSYFEAESESYIEKTEDLDTMWVERIQALSNKNISLLEVRNLKVKTVDGAVVAHAKLVINDVGATVEIESDIELYVNENTSIFEIKYLIKDVTNEEIRLEIEDALSGIVK